MSKFLINSSSYVKIEPASQVCEIQPFIEQRDIDVSRLQPIIEKLKLNIKEHKEFRLDNPIVILECEGFNDFLIDKNENRTNRVIIDGQHRVASLKEVIKGRPKYGNLTIPIFVHIVKTIEEGRKIQYDVFEQKPVDDYDKIQRNKYSLSDMIDRFIINYRKTKKSAVKYFKDGRYGDKSIRPRKYNFMIDELVDKIKNSSNIEIWVKREIQPAELHKAFEQLIKNKLHELSEKTSIDDCMKFVGITTEKNFTLFQQFLEKTPFQIIPYVYFTKYEALVSDIELILEITSIEDEFESDDEFFSDDD